MLMSKNVNNDVSKDSPITMSLSGSGGLVREGILFSILYQ